MSPMRLVSTCHPKKLSVTKIIFFLLLLLAICEIFNSSDFSSEQSFFKPPEKKSKHYVSGTPWQAYDYVITPNLSLCNANGSKNFPLLVTVTSRPHGFDLRRSIRQTYAKVLNRLNVRPVFLIGRSDNVTESKLEEESKNHSDLLVVDFMDTYQNLSLKTFVAFDWANDLINNNEPCLQGETKMKPKFLLKIDDDVFLYAKNLLRFLNDHTSENMTAFCFKWTKMEVRRDPGDKWSVKREIYPNVRFPDFCAGFSYVLTVDCLHHLLDFVQPLNWYLHLEDVLFTGIAGDAVGIRKIGDTRFGGWSKNDFTVHYIKADEIQRMHKDLNDSQIFVV